MRAMARIGPRSLDSHYPPKGGLVLVTPTAFWTHDYKSNTLVTTKHCTIQAKEINAIFTITLNFPQGILYWAL